MDILIRIIFAIVTLITTLLMLGLFICAFFIKGVFLIIATSILLAVLSYFLYTDYIFFWGGKDDQQK